MFLRLEIGNLLVLFWSYVDAERWIVCESVGVYWLDDGIEEQNLAGLEEGTVVYSGIEEPIVIRGEYRRVESRKDDGGKDKCPDDDARNENRRRRTTYFRGHC